MTRNLKALGLVLAIVCAVSAAIASAASAEQLTSDGPVKLTGKDSGEKFTLTGFGSSVSCEGEYDIGLENQTPHVYFDPTILFVSTFTVAPSYTNCKSGENEVTVGMNGCDYLAHVGNGTVTWEVVCPESAQIEARVYLNPAHTMLACTLKVPAQSKTSAKGAENIVEGGVEKVVFRGPVEGVKVTKSGLCGSGETTSAVLSFHIVVSAVNESGKPTGIKIG